jgi:hypothetical protein
VARQEAVAIEQRVVFCVGLAVAQPVARRVGHSCPRLNESDRDASSLTRHPNNMYGTALLHSL